MERRHAGEPRVLEEDREKRRKMMLEDPMFKVLFIVSLPMVISMMIESFYNIADAFFVSKLGEAATAAVGINDSLAQLIRAISMGFGVGASSYISRLMGAKEEDKASCVATTILVTAMLTILCIACGAMAALEPLVKFLGSTEGAKQYAMDYAKFILAAAPFTTGEVVLSQVLRAEGSSRLSMVGMLSGCIVNFVLDPIFIFKLDMEVAGAALATAISKVVSFAILLSPYLRNKTLLELKKRFLRPSREIYKEVARMGIPSLLRSSMLSVSGIVTNNVASTFSDVALAASSVSHRCTRLVSAAVVGFSQGLQPIAGYCWGAKCYRRVKEAVWKCCLIGAIGGMVLGAVLFLAASELVAVFAEGNRGIIEIGTLMIRSQCITMIPHVWVGIGNSLFLALGWAKTSTVLGLSRQLICFVPCVVLLSTLYGVAGLSVAQAAADILSLMITIPLVWRLMRVIKLAEANKNRQQVV